MSETITTPLTQMLGIKKPIILAGMNVAAGPELAAAVSAEGGLGVIGGVGYTPKFLQTQIDELKGFLKERGTPNAPFGVDLLLPKVGGNARKTNYDYTGGKLNELVDIIIKSGAKVFVSAVGLPPKEIVDKLHSNGLLVANMCGKPQHAANAAKLGADIVIAQGGEGGGHTGSVPTSVLIPKVCDAVRGMTSAHTKQPVQVVAAGGMFDGRSLAAALSFGAAGVWVGTRFIYCKESGAPPRHQQAVAGAGYDDTIRTIIYTGRPMRVIKTPYIMNWEDNRAKEIKQLTSSGVLPVKHDMEEKRKRGEEITFKDQMEITPLLMGKVAAAIEPKDELPTAKEIMDDMMSTAIARLKSNATLVSRL